VLDSFTLACSSVPVAGHLGELAEGAAWVAKVDEP
jgi:hypothetical protein